MIYVVVMQSIMILACLELVWEVFKAGRNERKELEDRLMAICHPLALVQVEVQKNSAEAEINYVGEELFSARTGVDNVAA